MNNIKLTIGIPVFNGEEFLKKRIESILNQTFSDFEIIISDNNSSDSSAMICREYETKDSRIKFFQQKKNIGGIANFKFVLDKSVSDYFVWAAVDDKWSENFLQKMIDVLNKNDSIVGCTSNVERFGTSINEFLEETDDSFFIKKYKTFRRRFRKFGTFSVHGTWHDKASFYMKNRSAQAIYSVFRREYLLKSFEDIPENFFDIAVLMSILRYGDIYALDETLWFYRTGGTSSESIIKKLKEKKLSFVEFLFSPSPFVKWLIKKFGIGFFIKNLDYVVFLYLINPIGLLMEIISKNKK